jgi:hypothetical protein
MVLIDASRKLAFFHVPKCAGRSVCQHLCQPGRDGTKTAKNYEGILDNGEDIAHVTLENASLIFGRALHDSVGREAGATEGVARLFRDGLPGYFKFCFVRDPYARVLSAYAQRVDPWYRRHWGRCIEPFPEFMEWLSRGIRSNRLSWDEPSVIHFKPGVFYTHDSEWRQQVDFIGKTENSDEDFQEALRLHAARDASGNRAGGEALGLGGLAAALPRVNQRAQVGGGGRSLAEHTAATIRIVNELYADDFDRFGYERVDPSDPRVGAGTGSGAGCKRGGRQEQDAGSEHGGGGRDSKRARGADGSAGRDQQDPGRDRGRDRGRCHDHDSHRSSRDHRDHDRGRDRDRGCSGGGGCGSGGGVSGSGMSLLDQLVPKKKPAQAQRVVDVKFLHVPKTAGSAIKHVLAKIENGAVFGEDFLLETASASGAGAKVQISSGGHSTARDFPGGAFKFALIRHPVDRFLSAFDFVREGGKNHPLKGKVPQAQRWQPFLERFGSLSEFLRDGEAVRTITDPASGHTHFWSLRHWLCSSAGGGGSCDGVDCFIRQEHLEEDFGRLCRLLRLRAPPVSIPKFNVTGSRAAVSGEDRRQLEHMLRDDIALYERLLARCGEGSGAARAWAAAEAKINRQFER